MKKIKMFGFFIFLCLYTLSAAAYDRILFITPDEFSDEIKPLKKFKDYSGRDSYLITLSQVYSSNSGVDNPEKIKKCIEYYVHHHGVDHVVLVGDVNKMPVRWRWWGRWMPEDPYFRGTWSVSGGLYTQSDAVTERAFCSWIDIGNSQNYTIEVDCRITGGVTGKREARVHFADADRHNGRQRIDILEQSIRLVQCDGKPAVTKTFNLNQTYKIKIQVNTNQVTVWIDNVQMTSSNLDSIDPLAFGKIGLGSFACSVNFDNLVITSNSVVVVDENFNDGIANNFTDAPTMEERNWMPSDLYYADLYKSNGSFDDWDYNNNNLFGEIEFVIPGYNPSAVLNNDRVDYLPDVSIGRIPASTAEEVSRYVKKVIYYETMTKQADTWFNRAVLYEGTNGGSGNNSNIKTSLQNKGFTVSNRAQSGDLENLSAVQLNNLIVSNINQGYGMINYIGHGNTDEWSCVNFTDDDVKTKLTNYNKLPIVFASACFTGQFAPIPPVDAYLDVNNLDHTGTENCERFPGPPDKVNYSLPKALQLDYDKTCIAEDFLFNAGTPAGTAGALVYLGERCAGRDGGYLLAEYFFKAFKKDVTVGDMWNKMIQDYYVAKNFSNSHTWNYGPEKWADGHYFDEAQKFILFGDPSAIAGGAYNNNKSGTVYNSITPFYSAMRYRVTGDLIIPAGQMLRSDSTLAMLFESGKKITAMDTGTQKGFILSPGYDMTACLLSAPKSPNTCDNLCGIVVYGELKLRNGGQIKFY